MSDLIVSIVYASVRFNKKIIRRTDQDVGDLYSRTPKILQDDLFL